MMLDRSETHALSEAAAALRISRTHLNKLLDAGMIPFRQLEGGRDIDRADLVHFLSLRAAATRELAKRFAQQDAVHQGAIVELVELLPD
ncbi:MAG: hypothetical protein Q4A82_07335 [Corynebacterium sp.]|nr:hypothetical protein [Corynebacterium sp.]